MKTLLVLVGLLLVASVASAQDNWFSSGVVIATVQAPIAANQVLVDGRFNDQSGGFLEEVDIICAATVTGFVALQRVDMNNVVVHSQPIQVGLGASPYIHFHVTENPGDHLRIVNLLNLTSAVAPVVAVAVSMVYTN